MKEEYEYRYPLVFSEHPYQEVTIPESSIVTKLFCKHEMVPLVRERKVHCHQSRVTKFNLYVVNVEN